MLLENGVPRLKFYRPSIRTVTAIGCDDQLTTQTA